MGVYSRNGNFYIDYYAGGKRKREMVGTSKGLAETVLQKRKVEIAENKFLDINREQKIKLEDFATQYLDLHCKSNHKPGSLRRDINAIRTINKFFGGKYMHEITHLDIEKFKAERIKNVTPATVNRSIALLKSMYNRAIEWDKAKDNPVLKVKLFKENNKRVRYLEREEITKLLAECNEHLKPIVIVALNTGMRKGEILSLKWHDVDFRRGIIYLLNSKNSEKRELPINDQVKTVLIKVRKHPGSPYIFCKANGQPYGDIKKSFLTAISKSGIINFHFHDLRHTFASQLVMSGVDLNTVRELMGHKTLEMTIRYSHLSPDHKKRAVDILSKRIVTGWAPASNSEEAVKEPVAITI